MPVATRIWKHTRMCAFWSSVNEAQRAASLFISPSQKKFFHTYGLNSAITGSSMLSLMSPVVDLHSHANQ